MIHPTAIIHPAATLGVDVTVGPYVVIEGAAVIGDGCEIQAHAVIGGHVTMGKRNLIGYGAVIGGDPQDFSFKPEIHSEVRIGDDNKIREYSTIHRGSQEGGITQVGDQCFLMGGTHLAHDVQLGNKVVIANDALLGGHVQVGDSVFIGGGCVFHQHIRIGTLAICQGQSGFGKDIPPFVTAAEINGVAGVNVIGLRRAGFNVEQRAEIKASFTLLYRSGRNVSQAVAEAGQRQWGEAAQTFWGFVGNSKKRGLCDLISTRRKASAPEAE